MKHWHKMLSKTPQKQADFYITNEKNDLFDVIGNSGRGGIKRIKTNKFSLKRREIAKNEKSTVNGKNFF